jgi:glucose-6-phosphate isomerase
MSSLTRLPAWQALAAHRLETRFELRALFAAVERRFERFSIAQGELLLDYSKHWLTDETMRLLVALAAACDMPGWIARLMSGETINVTEGRAALHTALRARRPVMLDGRDVTLDVSRVRAQMKGFCDALRAGTVRGATGRPITDVINIGIGGSDLGPALVVEALQPYAVSQPRVHFMSNVDGAHVDAILSGLDPETTLAIIVSKTFSTQETLTNA